jgi:tRNA (cmo5U34)-methyltransferase
MIDDVRAARPQTETPARGAPDTPSHGRSWQDSALVQNYLTGMRGAFPGATEQFTMMVQLVATLQRPVSRVLDLGAGDGVLTAALLDAFPGVEATILDFSPPMLAAARERFADVQPPVRILDRDLATEAWARELGSASLDVVVSGYAIHHLTDERKRAVYRDVFDLLTPGGIFINMEHVASPSVRLAQLFDQSMVDALTQFRRREDPDLSRAAVEREYASRPDRHDNILQAIDVQCDWLRTIGFQEVDCYYKWYELALFGGFKPAEAQGSGSA